VNYVVRQIYVNCVMRSESGHKLKKNDMFCFSNKIPKKGSLPPKSRIELETCDNSEK
jgi:hypothetical protein